MDFSKSLLQSENELIVLEMQKGGHELLFRDEARGKLWPGAQGYIANWKQDLIHILPYVTFCIEMGLVGKEFQMLQTISQNLTLQRAFETTTQVNKELNITNLNF